MKKFFFFLLILVLCNTVIAQSVGIGTTNPNTSAQLDISSSTKGMLLPRMSQLNRSVIINPANGLLVYDTTTNRLYQHQDGVWRYLINNTYWAQSSTRNWVYNQGDSVGIGTSVPTQRLDVNGNIRSRDDVLADGRVIATGTVSGSGLQTPGGLTVGSNGLVGGNFTANGSLATNGDLTVNNTGATLQLKNGSAVNKGFFQISGDNVRMGTNSGNSTGNLILRMNGSDRVNINAAGDIDLDGKVTKQSVTGAKNLLPLCYGFVNANGTIRSGTGNFTVVKRNDFGLGVYEITCAGTSTGSIGLVTGYNGTLGQYFYNTTLSKIFISTYNVFVDESRDADFSFLIYE